MLDSVVDSAWLERHLINAEMKNSVSKVLSVDCKDASVKGDNYASQIMRITVKVVLASGKTKTKNFIMKKEKGGATSDVLKEFNVFKFETHVFTTIFSLMEDLMDEFDDNRGKMWAQHIAHIPYSAIVLEDLQTLGYRVADRKKMMDLDHGLLVLRTLARFHAISKILMSRNLLSAKDLSVFFLDRNSKVIENLFGGTFSVFGQAVDDSWGEEWKGFGDKLRAQSPVICEKLRKIAAVPEDAFEVMCHGDCWTCNLMFKYSEYGSAPIDVKFLDFQMSHVNSYIWDIIYFAYGCIVPSIRRSHMDILLAAYQESLARNLSFFGWTGPIPTLNDVQKEAERVDVAALAFTCFTLPVTSTNEITALDIAELKNSTSSFVNPNIFKEEKFIQNVGEDLKIFASKGVL